MKQEHAIESLEYWIGITECDCYSSLPQGGCLHCDLKKILDHTKNQHKLIKNFCEAQGRYHTEQAAKALIKYNKK